jgi:hypothetical protein
MKLEKKFQKNAAVFQIFLRLCKNGWICWIGWIYPHSEPTLAPHRLDLAGFWLDFGWIRLDCWGLFVRSSQRAGLSMPQIGFSFHEAA